MARADGSRGSRRDNAAAARVTEQRKVLGDHEQHEVQRLSRQQSGSTQRSPRKGRRSGDAGSSGQALLSIVAVVLIFAGVMYWSVVLLMPKDS